MLKWCLKNQIGYNKKNLQFLQVSYKNTFMKLLLFPSPDN